MTSMSRTERALLCDLALQVGSEQPTLCADWTVKDLVVHLLVRERSPAAVGIVVPPLARLTDLASARLARQEFRVLVERLRSGPPLYSPLGWGPIEPVANTVEFFVHHEDVRRAQPEWQPRELGERQQAGLWKAVARMGRLLAGSASAGVVAERADTGDTARLGDGSDTVVVRGLPSEIVLFLFGRKEQARVELAGPQPAVAALRAASLGI